MCAPGKSLKFEIIENLWLLISIQQLDSLEIEVDTGYFDNHRLTFHSPTYFIQEGMTEKNILLLRPIRALPSRF